MMTNTKITVYHKTFDTTTKLTKWQRHNYDMSWWFGGKNSVLNSGYQNSDNYTVRIFYENNSSMSILNFSIGDIVVKGKLSQNIQTQQDLDGYELFNITSINNNDFGINRHIHLGGK